MFSKLLSYSRSSSLGLLYPPRTSRSFLGFHPAAYARFSSQKNTNSNNNEQNQSNNIVVQQEPEQQLHKTQRRLDKVKEAQLVSQIQNMETVAQQDSFTLKELNAIIADRKAQMEELVKETKIPVEAILFSLVTTLPMLAGSAYLYNSIALSALPLAASFPHLFESVLKFIAVHQCFQSGVHWGFAISSHDMQTDAINSTKEVRNQFTLACLPVIAAVANTFGLVYGVPVEGMLAMAPLSIMAGTQLFILGLDARIVASGEAPKWYLNMKIMISLLCFGSFALYAAMLMNHGKAIAEVRNAKSNPYLEYLPKSAESAAIPKPN